MMSTSILPAEKAAQIVNELTVIGEQLEILNNPQWLTVARAAAMLEALRLGLLQIDTTTTERRRHA